MIQNLLHRNEVLIIDHRIGIIIKKMNDIWKIVRNKDESKMN